MADTPDTRVDGSSSDAGDGGGSGALLPRSLHAGGAGGDGAPLARGAARVGGASVPRGEQADGRVDDDGDARSALAEARGGRLPARARAAAPQGDAGRLTIAIPAKGRLREPSVALLEEAGLGPEQPGERALAFPCRNGPADAIVDLVSSGNTMRTNGLRSLGVLFSSQAVLVARPGGNGQAQRLGSILRSVVEARATRYLMLNAPESALDAIVELVPGSRAPTVLPLTEP